MQLRPANASRPRARTGAACVLALTAAVVSASACGGKIAPNGSGAVTVSVSAEGGRVALDDDVTLDIPPGALPASTDITITRLDWTLSAVHQPYSAIYQFGPEGLTFARSARVTFKRTQGDTPAVFWAARRDPAFFERLGGESTDGAVSASVESCAMSGGSYELALDCSCSLLSRLGLECSAATKRTCRP